MNNKQEKKDWAMWYNHKSGKEIWIEEQERGEE
jgi:hypothetical protein